MKIYKKIVFDKNDNVIEEESFEYTGEVAKAGGSTFKKLVVIAVIVTAVVVLGNPAMLSEACRVFGLGLILCFKRFLLVRQLL
jgi:hypothetical protein